LSAAGASFFSTAAEVMMGEREAQPVAFLCLLSFGHAKESKSQKLWRNYY